MTSLDPGAMKKRLRSADTAKALLDAIFEQAQGLERVRFMEVCGTHTMAIRRSGIPAMLPENVELLSGPGCPVCVTPNATVDRAIALAGFDELIVATFGDMMRVPGSRTSLAAERARGADVRVVYSPLDALKLARTEAKRQVVFLGVGFETTTPTVAAVIRMAKEEGLENFSVLTSHKVVPPALDALLSMPDFSVSGFLMPGHVSAIIGADAYRPVAEQHGIPCVVAGFEPVDVLLSILMLLKQIRAGQAKVEIEYLTVVRPAGNREAQALVEQVLEPCDSDWRGVGIIPGSGLSLRDAYAGLDAEKRFDLQVPPPKEHPGCRCGEVLIGAIRPPDCALFGKACTPSDPVGPCMVSSEGTCAAYYKYVI